MPDERPTRAGLNTDQFRIECQTLDQGHRLSPRRQEAVGRPLNEPPVVVHGAKHAANAAAWFDNRHLTLARAHLPREHVGGREPGEACSDDERMGTGGCHGRTVSSRQPPW